MQHDQTSTTAGDPSAWLTLLKPWMAEAGTAGGRMVAGRRYALLAPQLAVITPDAWRRLDFEARRAAISSARAHLGASHPTASTVDQIAGSLELAVTRSPPSSCAPEGDEVAREVLAAAQDACANTPGAALRSARGAVVAARKANERAAGRNGEVAGVVAGGALAAAAVVAAVSMGPIGWLGLAAMKVASHSKEVQDAVGGAFDGVAKAANWATTPADAGAAADAAGRAAADGITSAILDAIEAEVVSLHWK